MNMDSSGFVRDRPGPPYAAEGFSDREAGLQPILMKPRAEIRAAKPGIAAALQRPKLFLRLHRPGVETRMAVAHSPEDRLGCDLAMRVERDEQRPIAFDPLKAVHPVGDGEPAAVKVIPGHVVPA